jgi:hypothetical protein
MINARARQIARDHAKDAKLVAELVEEAVGGTASALTTKIPFIGEALASLALAIELLADVSEKQEEEIDDLRAQLGEGEEK